MRPSEHPESAAPQPDVPATAAPEDGGSAAAAPQPDGSATAAPAAEMPTAAASLPNPVRVRRSLVGRVTSTKMLKTVTVLVERRVKHPLYGKYMVQSKKVHAHTDNPLRTGDVVEVQECRPISKTKTWMVVKVLDRAA